MIYQKLKFSKLNFKCIKQIIKESKKENAYPDLLP